MILPSALQPMFTSFSLLWRSGYTSAKIWHPQVATIVTQAQSGNVSQLVNGWLDTIPMMREWVGPRVIHDIAARAHTMTAKDYELTMGIPVNTVNDDQWGLYSGAPMDLGLQSAKNPGKLIADKLIANPTGFDGVSFFNDAHPVNFDQGAGGPLGTYDNSFALALTPENLGIVIATMLAYKGADGEEMGVGEEGVLLVVPPALKWRALEITQSENLASFVMGNTTAGNVGTSTNVYKGAASVLCIPKLNVDPTRWYVMDVSRPIKPLIYWERQAPNFVYRGMATDPVVFDQKKYIFGVDGRAVADVTLPFLVATSKP